MPKFNYIYCDANVFLAYFNNEAQRVDQIAALFDEVQQNTHQKIITSVISITEVSHSAEERLRNRLNPQIYEAIESFWGDSSLIEFADFNELIARQARDLIRQAVALKYALRTNDAIHLTTAKYIGVTEFLTYDKKLEKFSGIMGYSIREPYINNPKLPLQFDDDKA